MRMFAFCGKCGVALSGAQGLCPPCRRYQLLVGAKQRRDSKQSTKR